MVRPLSSPSNSLLRELSEVGGNAKDRQFVAIFKKYVNPKDPNYHSQLTKAFDEVKKEIIFQKSTQGFEKEIDGVITGLNFLMKVVKTEDDMRVVKHEIDAISHFTENYNTQILLEQVAKARPDLSAACKNKDVASDIHLLLNLYGSKRSIPVATVILLMDYRSAAPQQFRNYLVALDEAKRENLKDFSKGLVPSKDSPKNQAASQRLTDLQMGALDKFQMRYPAKSDGSEGSKSSQEITLISVINELRTRSVPVNTQIHSETLLFPLNDSQPGSEDPGYRTYQQVSQAKNLYDQRKAQLLLQPKSSARDKELEILERRKDYFPLQGAFARMDWVRPDPSSEIWIHTLGFQSAEGNKKETPTELKLEFLGKVNSVQRQQIFEFLQDCDALVMKPNFEKILKNEIPLPESVRKKLNEISGLSDVQRNELLAVALKFSKDSNLAMFKDLFTFGS